MKNKKIQNLLSNFENSLAAVAIVLMMVIVFANAMARYIAGFDAAWSYELVTSCFVLVAMFSAANLFKTDGHVGFDYLVTHLPKVIQIPLIIIRHALCVTFFVFLIIFGFKMTQGKIALGLKSAVLGYPSWIIGAIVPVSGILCVIRYIQGQIAIYKKNREEHKE